MPLLAASPSRDEEVVPGVPWRPEGVTRASVPAACEACRRAPTPSAECTARRRPARPATCPSGVLGRVVEPSVYKPGSVGTNAGRSFLSGYGRPDPLAAYPRRFDRGGPPLAAYLALLQLRFTMPPALPRARWALTPPFHPYLIPVLGAIGGLISVALSVALRHSRTSARPGVTWQLALWSPDFPRDAARPSFCPTAPRPSDRRRRTSA